MHTILVRDLDTRLVFGLGEKLIIVFSAQHKLIIADVKSLEVKEISITFPWT